MNRDFVDLLRAFSDHRVEHLVVGAHALAVHGAIRATKVLDVCIRPSPENATRAYSALASFGAPLSELTPDDLASPGTVFQIGVAPVRIDILGPGRVEIDAINDSSFAGRMAAATRVGEVYMHDTKSMVDAVLTRGGGDQISRLNILDHAAAEGLHIGTDWVTDWNVNLVAPDLARLNGHFAPDGFVHLQGCDIGQNRDPLMRLSTILGVPVNAGTGKHNPVTRVNRGDYVRCNAYGCSISGRP